MLTMIIDISKRPLHLIHRSVSNAELLALYASADACVISSVRDGINLVAHEYIACQRQPKGVLLLSELAGVAQNFNCGITFNPWDIDTAAELLHRALVMEKDERAKQYGPLLECVMNQTR